MTKLKPNKPLDTTLHIDKDYIALLDTLKANIRNMRFKAAMAVNNELILLYWRIGQHILEKQEKTAWGSKFLETLSHDLRTAFPETSGFSVRNLKYMRRFAESYPEPPEIGQQLVAQLPWGHILLLIQKVDDETQRNWYIEQTIKNGWSRYLLDDNIKNDTYARQAVNANKASNFLDRLSSPQSGLAHDMLKNPYNLDFLCLHDEAHEREIEHASVQHVTKFLLELGKHFAFIGHQVPITINEQEFFIDMLFYHLKMRCHVVVEFKAAKFKPEHASQINFYLNAVDDVFRHPDDAPSVGILLCKSRDKIVAEYALKSIEKPIGISEYQLVKAIPKELKTNFPTVQEIEAELNAASNNNDEKD